MAHIRLEQVEKKYPQDHWAVRHLDLEVADGELLVLVGPSGCGKTTTLKLIAGLETPTHGRIWLDQDDVTRWPPHRRDLAMVFQNYALYPHLTVRGNLEFGLRMRRTPRPVIIHRVLEVARLLQLEDLLDRKPAQLSGGQRQRVALGRALARRPRVFLLDEPFAHLDAQLRVQTRTELRRLHQQLGATMLHVTHDQEEAMTLGDRVAVMRDGALQQLAAPMAIYRRPINQFVATFIGSPAMNLFPCTCRRIEQGCELACPFFRLHLPITADEAALPAEVIFGVRPHDMQLASGVKGDADAQVEMVQPLGSEVVVNLSLKAPGGHQPITLVTATANSPQSGDLVRLHFPPACIHLFDPQDGKRLEQLW